PRQAGPAANAFEPVRPSAAAGEVAPGAIYNPAATFDLFMDLRARQVGDILTVLLVERTNASKESSTSTEKGTSVDTGLPIFGGKQPTHNGRPILNNEIDSSSSFDGKADSSQSNRLDGSITVTVADRLPNGNLLVRGEKQITINQGQEYVRLEGIVRPVDIGPQNTVPSTMIGDARITYSGKGALADANHPGWLGRFFNSRWFPF
ncbi:MAG TPA: flagellar basal body L-ring protein FlgH, partial [Gammaproteobacteria bacterium]|nr:flagellar basal body L-ring protein FlgH [Gammaproteobacteria bacterium]